MLEIKDIRVTFGNLVAVDNFSMVVKQHTIHSLIGPNGAGKTTVFNAIYNFVNYSGDIIFLGRSLKNIPSYKRISLGLSRTFQNLSLFYSMTVEENIKMGLHHALKTNVLKDIVGIDVMNSNEVREKVQFVLDLLNIAHLAKAYPVFLPYGIQKLVELGRAIVSSPKLVLLDEPAAGLNDTEKVVMKEILLKIKNMGVTLLVVEHDMGIVMDLSDTVSVMNYGIKIAEGSPDEVSKDKEVIKAYLGV